MAVVKIASKSLAQNRSTTAFNAVKIFSATLAAQRSELGDVVTRWLQEHRLVRIVDVVVTQSSDAEYHCLTITLFFIDDARDR